MFLSTELDGKCCFARADDASMDAYLEIGYHMGADAQTLAGTLLNDYGTIASMETLGEVKLGGLTAYGARRHGTARARGVPDPDGERLHLGRALPCGYRTGELV